MHGTVIGNMHGVMISECHFLNGAAMFSVVAFPSQILSIPSFSWVWMPNSNSVKSGFEVNFQLSGRHSVFERIIRHSVFERIIRHFAGFLSAFQLKKERFFLDKAKEIGETILPLFKNPGLFLTFAHFPTNLEGRFTASPDGNPEVLLSDIGSAQLEFYQLSMLTGDMRFAKTAAKIHKTLFDRFPDSGLYPERVDAETGDM
jgi:hypothetical protein